MPESLVSAPHAALEMAADAFCCYRRVLLSAALVVRVADDKALCVLVDHPRRRSAVALRHGCQAFCAA